MRISLVPVVVLCMTESLILAGDELHRSKTTPKSQPIAARHAEFFEARIRPVLAEHCFSCHGPKKQQSGLRLDSRGGLLKGADSGLVVVPGRPEESPLIEVIRHDATIKMPPKSKLPAQAIIDLTTWIRIGVPWPRMYQGPALIAQGGLPPLSAQRQKVTGRFRRSGIRRRRRSRILPGHGPRLIDLSWHGLKARTIHHQRGLTSGL